MRKSDRLAEEKRRENARECFQVAKEGMWAIVSRIRRQAQSWNSRCFYPKPVIEEQRNALIRTTWFRENANTV